MSGLSNKYALAALAESIQSNFAHYRCPKSPAHSSYEYICTVEHCQYGTLVCTDCLKAEASHIAEHGPCFMRVKEVVEYFGQFALNKTGSEQKEIEEIRRIAKKSERASKIVAEQLAADSDRLHQFFKRLETSLVSSVKQWSKSCCDRVLEQLAQKHRADLQAVRKFTEDCKMMLSLEELGLVRELDDSLRKKSAGSMEDFVTKVQAGLALGADYYNILREWVRKPSPFSGATTEVTIRPAVDFKAFDIYSARIVEELEAFLQGLNLDPLTDNIKDTVTAQLPHYRPNDRPEPSQSLAKSSSKRQNLTWDQQVAGSNPAKDRDSLQRSRTPTKNSQASGKPLAESTPNRNERSAYNPSVSLPTDHAELTPAGKEDFLARVARDVSQGYGAPASRQNRPPGPRGYRGVPEIDIDLREELSNPIRLDQQRARDRSTNATHLK